MVLTSFSDSQWFKFGRSIDTGDNWVLKFNNLKKLYKLLTSFYEEVLGQNTSYLDVPNLTAIAKDANKGELVKLTQLILALAVQCENNQKYILQIQSLEEGSQHALMVAIEQVMSRLATAKNSVMTPTDNITSPLKTNAAFDTLESENAALREQVRLLQLKYDDLASEKKELQLQMEASSSVMNEGGKIDFLLKNEIDSLKQEVERSETKRLELDTVAEKQGILIKELTKKIEDAQKKSDEAMRLKDQLDELRHVADKLQKAEAMIEKYKKKMEESADFRRQMKLFEAQNQQLSERNRQLEEEYKKISGLKPLVETYKEQLTTMESKISLMQVENSKTEFEMKELRGKIERAEVQRRNDQDLIQSLEEQIRDLEAPRESFGGIPLSAEGVDSYNSYRTRIKDLEEQVERYKSSVGGDIEEKLRQFENDLNESQKLKDKFEKDYMVAVQRNLALENEMKQLRSISVSDSQAEREAIEAKLAETQQELATVKRRLAENEIAVAQGQHSNTGSADLEKLKRQLDSYEKESRMQIGQIHKLSREKDALEGQCMELKDTILQYERTASDLKAALAALESKGHSADETTQKLASATQKIVQLTEQNTKLHKALKEAKKDNFAEAIASYDTMIRDKDDEIEKLRKELADTRKAARREQELMVSAWYDTILAQQRRNPYKADGSPSSWLAQQRKHLALRGRTASVVCQQDCELLVLTKHKIEEALADSEDLKRKLSDCSKHKLAWWRQQRYLEDLKLFGGEFVGDIARKDLRKVSFFASASDAVIDELSMQIKTEVVSKGTTIIMADDNSTDIYFIVRGNVLVVGRTGDVHAEIAAGSVFGEVGVIMNLKRTASIIAKDDCCLLKLTRESLMQCLEKHKSLRDKLNEIVQERYSLIEKRSATTRNVEEDQLDLFDIEVSEQGLLKVPLFRDCDPSFIRDGLDDTDSEKSKTETSEEEQYDAAPSSKRRIVLDSDTEYEGSCLTESKPTIVDDVLRSPLLRTPTKRRRTVIASDSDDSESSTEIKYRGLGRGKQSSTPTKLRRLSEVQEEAELTPTPERRSKRLQDTESLRVAAKKELSDMVKVKPVGNEIEDRPVYYDYDLMTDEDVESDIESIESFVVSDGDLDPREGAVFDCICRTSDESVSDFVGPTLQCIMIGCERWCHERCFEGITRKEKKRFVCHVCQPRTKSASGDTLKDIFFHAVSKRDEKACLKLAEGSGDTLLDLVWAKARQRSALHLACEADMPNLVEKLLSLDAEVGYKDLDGATSLHVALAFSPKCTKVIVDHILGPLQPRKINTKKRRRSQTKSSNEADDIYGEEEVSALRKLLLRPDAKGKSPLITAAAYAVEWRCDVESATGKSKSVSNTRLVDVGWRGNIFYAAGTICGIPLKDCYTAEGENLIHIACRTGNSYALHEIERNFPDFDDFVKMKVPETGASTEASLGCLQFLIGHLKKLGGSNKYIDVRDSRREDNGSRSPLLYALGSGVPWSTDLDTDAAFAPRAFLGDEAEVDDAEEFERETEEHSEDEKGKVEAGEGIQQSDKEQGQAEDVAEDDEAAQEERVVCSAVKLLLECGLSPHSTDVHGSSLLHLAAADGLSDVVRHLLQLNIPADVTDKFGWYDFVMFFVWQPTHEPFGRSPFLAHPSGRDYWGVSDDEWDDDEDDYDPFYSVLRSHTGVSFGSHSRVGISVTASFKGEEGYGPGVTREFWTCFGDQMLDPSHGVFGAPMQQSDSAGASGSSQDERSEIDKGCGNGNVFFADDNVPAQSEWWRPGCLEAFKTAVEVKKQKKEVQGIDVAVELSRHIGRMMASAIVDEQVLPGASHLCPVIFKWLADPDGARRKPGSPSKQRSGGKPSKSPTTTPEKVPDLRLDMEGNIGMDDLSGLDREFHRHLTWLLDNNIGKIGDDLGLTFSVDQPTFDPNAGRTKVVTKALVPHGEEIAVTEENKKEYVKLAVQERLSRCFNKRAAFLEGFWEVCPPQHRGFFTPTELEILVAGETVINLDLWKQLTTYSESGCPTQDISALLPGTRKVVEWFWRVVEFDMTPNERLSLLQFATGSSRPPPPSAAYDVNGWKFNVCLVPGISNKLPSASTCMLLPKKSGKGEKAAAPSGSKGASQEY
ncbi:E3 ubiquitin-protein ligase [Phlyctochytrium bullatum]|nr:E3 ubiquitin-protein ligase [Phlyctochytrium bullatum]